MGYQVKWVEDNLGVTRKALRCFEEVGLMPKNKNRRYRDYDEEDINRIWGIRLLQGIGYTLKEIAFMIEKEDFDFEHSLAEKIVELEKEKSKIEKHLGYAKAIKLTGRMPTRPKEMGKITCEEFNNKSLNEWNVNNDPRINEYLQLVEELSTKTPEELEETELGKMVKLLENFSEREMRIYMTEKIFLDLLIEKKRLGSKNEEIQLIVKFLYENHISAIEDLKNLTRQQFSRIYSTYFKYGDIAKQHIKEYGQENCDFIADAIALFGGFEKYEEIEDKGL